MKIYLDLCCLNRPFDDQTQARVHLESQAVILILDRVEQGRHSLCNSAALVVENSLCPNLHRRSEVEELLSQADVWIPHGKALELRALELRKLGFREFDAYHLAAAEAGGCDRLATCDDRFLKAARRHAATITVTVTDPIQFASEAGF